jgi:hypothetical protein
MLEWWMIWKLYEAWSHRCFKWISEECTRPCFVQPKKYVNSTSTSETFLQIPVIVLAGSNGICPFNQKLSRDLLDLFNELQSILRILVSEQLACSFPKIMYRYGMIWHTVVLSSWRFAESQQHVLLWKPVINPADEKDMQRWIFPSYPWDPCCDGFPLGATALTSWYVVSVGESCWVHYLAHIRSWHSLGHDFDIFWCLDHRPNPRGHIVWQLQDVLELTVYRFTLNLDIFNFF